MRKHLRVEPSEIILGLGLFLSFVLLLAGVGFANARPGLASFLIFLFSTAFLGAAVLSKRAHFLYGSMLLGAVAYFMFFYAIGVSVVWFPFLAVPLVFILWIVAQFLYMILDPNMFAFPKTVIRAMNITVAIFTTIGILLSVLVEALLFFRAVPPSAGMKSNANVCKPRTESNAWRDRTSTPCS